MKKHMITILTTIVVLVATTITVTLAWLANLKESSSNINVTLDAPEDTLKLQGLYIGKDFDKNGELDEFFENNIKMDVEEFTKTEILENYFIRYTEADTNSQSLPSGSILTYRIVLKRLEDAKSNKFIINSFFTNIANDDQYIRLMFEMFDINVYEYSKRSYEEIKYGEILESDSSGSPLRKLLYTNPLETNFWELSNLDYFLGDGASYNSSNEYLEIDFKVKTIDTNKTNQYFNIYYNDLKDKINEMIEQDVTEWKSYLSGIDSLLSPSSIGYAALLDRINRDDRALTDFGKEKKELLLYYLNDLNHLYNSIYKIVNSEDNEISGELNFDIYITVTPTV